MVIIWKETITAILTSINLLWWCIALEKVSSYRYLGVVFNQNMNFSDHVNLTLSKSSKAAHCFWKCIIRFQTIKTSEILNLFDILVISVLVYNAEIWYPWILTKRCWPSWILLHTKSQKNTRSWNPHIKCCSIDWVGSTTHQLPSCFEFHKIHPENQRKQNWLEDIPFLTKYRMQMDPILERLHVRATFEWYSWTTPG